MRIADMDFIPFDTLASWQDAEAFRTGDADTDANSGVILADIALKLAKQDESAMPLAQILADIVSGGELGPLEAGFLTRVATVARLGSMD